MNINILEFISKGGIVMYPLLMITFLAFTFSFDRYFALRRNRSFKGSIDKVRELLKEGKFEEAEQLVANKNGAIPRLLEKGIYYIHHEESLVEDRLKELIYEEMIDLEKHLPTISTFAGLMTLMGLLGAVTGMISVFNDIAMVGTGNAQAVARGLSEVLVSTQTGLAAAIPTLYFHNHLSIMVDQIVLDLKRTATMLIFMSRLHKQKG